jgi:hypothetical protein
MIEIDKRIVNLLVNDATLTAIVPADNIFVGDVDVIAQTSLNTGIIMPAIIVTTSAEAMRPVPSYCRDTQVVIDIYNNNSQLEVETIYERIIEDMSYITYNQDTAHIFWQLLSGGTDVQESDRRVFHRSMTLQVWSHKL